MQVFEKVSYTGHRFHRMRPWACGSPGAWSYPHWSCVRGYYAPPMSPPPLVRNLCPLIQIRSPFSPFALENHFSSPPNWDLLSDFYLFLDLFFLRFGYCLTGVKKRTEKASWRTRIQESPDRTLFWFVIRIGHTDPFLSYLVNNLFALIIIFW